MEPFPERRVSVIHTIIKDQTLLGPLTTDRWRAGPSAFARTNRVHLPIAKMGLREIGRTFPSPKRTVCPNHETGCTFPLPKRAVCPAVEDDEELEAVFVPLPFPV